MNYLLQQKIQFKIGQDLPLIVPVIVNLLYKVFFKSLGQIFLNHLPTNRYQHCHTYPILVWS